MRIRDKACPRCALEGGGSPTLILRQSLLCHRHNGEKSGRTFTCEDGCRAVHARCERCGTLCGPEHLFDRRDTLCYREGDRCCWAMAHNAGRPVLSWLVTCINGHTRYPPARPLAGSRCPDCGSRILEAEPLVGFGSPGKRVPPAGAAGAASAPFVLPLAAPPPPTGVA